MHGKEESTNITSRHEHAIYFIRRALKDAETRSSKIEKMVSAMVYTAEKTIFISPYNQRHHRIPTKGSIGASQQVQPTSEVVSMMTKFNYEPQISEKGQVLVDILVVGTHPNNRPKPESQLGGRWENNTNTLEGYLREEAVCGQIV